MLTEFCVHKAGECVIFRLHPLDDPTSKELGNSFFSLSSSPSFNLLLLIRHNFRFNESRERDEPRLKLISRVFTYVTHKVDNSTLRRDDSGAG